MGPSESCFVDDFVSCWSKRGHISTHLKLDSYDFVASWLDCLLIFAVR